MTQEKEEASDKSQAWEKPGKSSLPCSGLAHPLLPRHCLRSCRCGLLPSRSLRAVCPLSPVSLAACQGSWCRPSFCSAVQLIKRCPCPRKSRVASPGGGCWLQPGSTGLAAEDLAANASSRPQLLSAEGHHITGSAGFSRPALAIAKAGKPHAAMHWHRCKSGTWPPRPSRAAGSMGLCTGQSGARVGVPAGLCAVQLPPALVHWLRAIAAPLASGCWAVSQQPPALPRAAGSLGQCRPSAPKTESSAWLCNTVHQDPGAVAAGDVTGSQGARSLGVGRTEMGRQVEGTPVS